jgi:hypothetical protein
MAVSGALYRIPTGTKTPTTLMNSQGQPKYAAFGPKAFYWSDGTTIKAISLSGGAYNTPTASPIRTLYTVPSGTTIFGVGVLGNSVYWLDTSAFNLMKVTPN